MERASLGKIHPTFMGGEYLPNYRREEVEIARIELASTTSDVISLRARPTGSRIKYSLLDEYNTEFCLPQKTSCRPFSLRELIRFLDSVDHPKVDPSWKCFGFVLSYNECNLDCGIDLETLQDFTSVSSDFYLELGWHYSEAIEEWYLGREGEGARLNGDPQVYLRGGFEGYREECGRAVTRRVYPTLQEDVVYFKRYIMV